MTDAVAVSGASKIFPLARGQQVVALETIDLTVSPGEFVSLILDPPIGLGV